jgi:hypothetical protein
MLSLIRRVRRTPRLTVFAVVAALALGAALPLTALAAPSLTASTHVTCDLACVQQFGDARIAERITALNNLNARVQTALNNKRVTNAQADPLFNDISTNEAGLNSLKAKLDAETSLDAARQDVKNIYVQLRIYAVVLPRDARTLYLDGLTNVHERLLGLEGKIQSALAKAGNPPTLVALFNDYKNQLQSAQAQIDAANGELPTLTVDNFNNNRTTFETALTNLKTDEHTAHADLKNAVSDLHQIVQALRQSTPPSPSSPSPSPTA